VNAKAIQTFMGHPTIEMTFGQYGHLMPGSREQAASWSMPTSTPLSKRRELRR
jgi:integrase